MQKRVINYRRVSRLVKSEIDYEVYKARDYYDELKRDPNSVEAEAKKDSFISGISFEKGEGRLKVFVTVNKEFLSCIGYDDNLEGFLADYFGTDFKPEPDSELKFRYIDGVLVNPTKVEKK